MLSSNVSFAQFGTLVGTLASAAWGRILFSGALFFTFPFNLA
jgi:hypothetical protein